MRALPFWDALQERAGICLHCLLRRFVPCPRQSFKPDLIGKNKQTWEYEICVRDTYNIYIYMIIYVYIYIYTRLYNFTRLYNLYTSFYLYTTSDDFWWLLMFRVLAPPARPSWPPRCCQYWRVHLSQPIRDRIPWTRKIKKDQWSTRKRIRLSVHESWVMLTGTLLILTFLLRVQFLVLACIHLLYSKISNERKGR